MPMRRALAIVVLLAACGSDESLPTGEITARVTHYDYEIDIETRSAHAELTLAIDKGGDCVTLPLRATLQNTPTIDDDPVNATTVDGGVKFCGVGYPEGSTIKLAADSLVPLATLGVTQVGYSITPDGQGNDFHYLLSWLGGCDQFAPCDNRPDQFATYRFTVRHPAGYVARCPGTIAETSDTETTCTFDYQAPTYSAFSVVAAPGWMQTPVGTWGDHVQVTLYDHTFTQTATKLDSAYHAGFVGWLEQLLGPYPYGDELRILTAPTYWGGFEHPGNIVIDDGLARILKPVYYNELTETVNHEITHMWAGNQTTLADTLDFAWKESMAEYLPYVYEDLQQVAPTKPTTGVWKTYAPMVEHYLVPTDGPALVDFYGDSYMPGPMILFRQLEVMSSRDQVLAAIASALAGHGTLSMDDLVAALETSTGLDLKAYAAGWIRGAGKPEWPRFDVTYATGPQGAAVTLTQVAGGTAMGCKFHVALLGSGAGEKQLVEVNTYTGGMNQTLQIPTPSFTVTSVQLDPLNECLVYANTTTPRVVPERTNPWITGRVAPPLDQDFSRF